MNILKTIGAMVRDPGQAIAYALPYVNAALEPAARGAMRLRGAADDLSFRMLNSPLATDPAGVAKRNPGKTTAATIVGLTLASLGGYQIHNESVGLASRIRQTVDADGNGISKDKVSTFIRQADEEGRLPALEQDIRTIRIGFGDMDLVGRLEQGVKDHNSLKATNVISSMDGNGDGSISFPEAVNYASTNPQESTSLSENLRAVNPNVHSILLRARQELSSNPSVRVK